MKEEKRSGSHKKIKRNKEKRSDNPTKIEYSALMLTSRWLPKTPRISQSDNRKSSMKINTLVSQNQMKASCNIGNLDVKTHAPKSWIKIK